MNTPTSPCAAQAGAACLLRPGETCDSLCHAGRLRLLVDAEEYFATLRQAIVRARRSVIIVGWDIDSRIELVPGGADDGFPAALGNAFLVLRGFEFTTLNVMWYANAYGSIVWLLLGLHTTHLVTDAVDTAVLVALLYRGPFEGKRLVDTSENAIYWYFVVLSWLPIYAVVYLVPRVHL